MPNTAANLHVVEKPRPVVLMHGFPDDHHIYDHLTALLDQRTVAFKFPRYGQSDRPAGRAFAREDRQRDLTAVIDTLHDDRVVLVGHDASGPEAIERTLEHPDRVARLILLNTYSGHHETLGLPEMIRLLADPPLCPLAEAMIDDPPQRLWLLGHTAKQFGIEVGNPDGVGVNSIAAQFFECPAGPDALSQIRAWTADLFGALDAQDQRVKAGELGTLDVPVGVIFGAADAYLDPDLARHLASQIPSRRATTDRAGWPLAPVGPAPSSRQRDHDRDKRRGHSLKADDSDDDRHRSDRRLLRRLGPSARTSSCRLRCSSFASLRPNLKPRRLRCNTSW